MSRSRYGYWDLLVHPIGCSSKPMGEQRTFLPDTHCCPIPTLALPCRGSKRFGFTVGGGDGGEIWRKLGGGCRRGSCGSPCAGENLLFSSSSGLSWLFSYRSELCRWEVRASTTKNARRHLGSVLRHGGLRRSRRSRRAQGLPGLEGQQRKWIPFYVSVISRVGE